MDESMGRLARKKEEKRKSKKRLKRFVGVLGMLVLLISVHQLILPALTMEKTTYCGDDTHTHTVSCYSNPAADVEAPDKWYETLPASSGNKQTDLVNMAESQLGYRESRDNYVAETEEILKGYTRYGHAAGDPYGDWNLYFTQFLTDAAQIEMPKADTVTALKKALQKTNTLLIKTADGVEAGDLAFFDEKGSLEVGIVAKVRSNGSVTVIAGDQSDKVARVNLSQESGKQKGFAVLVPHSEKNDTGLAEDLKNLSKETLGARLDIETPVTVKAEQRKSFRSRMSPYAAKTDINMRDMITEVTVEKLEGTKWVSVKDQDTIKEHDQIRFQIGYTVPGKALSSTNNTISYQLPQAVKPQKAESGKVFNNENREVGTYIIDTNGLIRICFNEQYVQDNSLNQPIQGAISFQGSVQKAGEGEVENVVLEFTDDIVLHLQVKEVKEQIGDIHIRKISENKSKNGLIAYTLIISSTEGTTGEVLLTDTITGGAYEKGLKVEDQLKNPVPIKTAVKKGDTSFQVTLPPMKPGEVYKVTYYGKPDAKTVVSQSGGIAVKNKATAESTDNLGAPLIESATNDQVLTVLGKYGKWDPDTGLVDFWILINEAHMDLSGWQLTDTIYNGTIVTKVMLEGESGTKKEITLPYTFPENSTEQYRISYKVKPSEDQLGDKNVINEAKLFRAPKEEMASSAKLVGVGKFNPIEKKADGKPHLEDGVVITPWNVTIHGLEGITGSIFYHDLLPEDKNESQYLTREQLEDARKTIEQVMKDNNIKITEFKVVLFGKDGNSDKWETESPTGRYRGFEYRIETRKPRDTSVSFTYETSADPGDGPIVLRNKVDLSLKAEAIAETVYKPVDIVVHKMDPDKPTNDVSEHKFETLEKGMVSWQVNLFIPENHRNHPVTITEQLPEGVDLAEFSVNAGETYDAAPGLVKDPSETVLTWNVNGKSAAVFCKRNGQTITAVLPPELNTYTDGIYQIFIKVKPNAELTWKDLPGGFKHEAELKNTFTAQGPGNPVSDTQTQIITKNDLAGSLIKTGTPGENNVITYTLKVNPNKLDLAKGIDKLKVTDTLVHEENLTLSANLVPGSVRMTAEDGAVTSPVYTFTKKHDFPKVGSSSYIMEMEVPDEQAVVLTYQYRFAGSSGQETFPVSNSAKLEGFQQDGAGDSCDLNVKMQESGAVANIKGIRIYKVDAKNQGVYLPGAEFTLAAWDEKEKQYVPVKDKSGNTTFVTNKKGQLSLTSENLQVVAYNTAYKLIESKAPEGYFRNDQPYYFYIGQDDIVNYPLLLPKDFKGDRLRDGSLIYYKDAKEFMDLSIYKKWQNEDGTVLDDPNVEEIQVKLYKQLPGKEKELVGTYPITKANGWKTTVEHLPTNIRLESGWRGDKYSYTVEEEPVPGFKVVTDETEVNSGGDLFVTNRKVPGYVLPSTGGIGIVPFILSGSAVMVLSVLFLLRKYFRVY